MSDFWAGWVMVLVVINYGTILLLFLWAPRVAIPTDPDGTTGHTWANGTIREGLNRLPRWWLTMSTAGFIASFIYLVLYPGFGNWKGILDWTSTQQMQGEIIDNKSKSQSLLEQIEAQSVLALGQNPQAMQLGKRLFEDNCAACHGYDAKGSHLLGAPNLTDNTWLYGGKTSDVIHSIAEGRNGMMPAWQAILGPKGVHGVAHYLLLLHDAEHDPIAAANGKIAFGQTCNRCHGNDGTGNQALGAPNLIDNDWLYGNNLEALTETIANGRNGHMPAWKERLTGPQIKVLAAWVLSHDNTAAALAAGEK